MDLNDIIKIVSPSWAYRRLQWQNAYTQLQAVNDRRRAFYEASQPRPGTEQQNFLAAGGDVPNFENIELRDKARAVCRNNPYAQAVVDGLVTRMSPITLYPEPGALLPDGSPDTKFNDRARHLWEEWSDKCLTIGGMNINQVFQQSAREIVVAGEMLHFYRTWETQEKKDLGLDVGLTLDVIESERLDNLKNTFGDTNVVVANGRIFQGIQVDQYGRRTKYWLRRGNPYHWLTLADWSSLPYDAKDFEHAYRAFQPSQYRGVSFLNPVMDTLMQIADWQWNELTSSTINACMAAVIVTLPETNFQFTQPNKDEPPEERFQKLAFKPGLVARLRPGEDIRQIEARRPYSGADAFIDSLLRSVAVGLGIKPSALTGDFKASSYSSEASAEIENLPRREALQDFFINRVAQPCYARLIQRARLEGYFDGFETTPEVDPAERHLYSAHWPQTQIRSINPQNDVAASIAKASSNLSSFKKESLQWGTDILSNMKDNYELIERAKEMGLPLEYVLKMFQIANAPIVINNPDATADNQQPPEQKPDENPSVPQ